MARRTSQGRNRIISEMNMTPLIDLTFLLLISFVITFPLTEQGIRCVCPRKGRGVGQTHTYSIAINSKAG